MAYNISAILDMTRLQKKVLKNNTRNIHACGKTFPLQKLIIRTNTERNLWTQFRCRKRDSICGIKNKLAALSESAAIHNQMGS